MQNFRDAGTIIDLTPHAVGQEPDEARNGEPRRASYNPATGALLGHVPLLQRDGIESAIRSAREAQRAWAARSLTQRAAVLHQFRAALVKEMDAVAMLISMEQGKPVVEAMTMEVMAVLAHLKWLADEGVKVLAERKAAQHHPLFTAKEAHYRFEPLGVIAIISPWNYPFSIPTIQMLTALLAGNGVVLKPSPFVPLVGQKIAELVRQSDLPSGLLHVIHVDDADAPHLTSHPEISKIVFTGMAETGRKVMASAAQVPTPVLLELGGKDAAIVAADAELARAVPGIVWYAMANAGQTCASVERVYVHKDVYERFVSEAVALVERLKVDEGRLPTSEVGPLTTEAQLALVETQVEEAQAQGARVLVGGYRLSRPGFFYAPTILVDVTPEMRIMREETFGPVLPIVRVESVDEAIRAANESGFGLSGSVWSRDKRQALDAAAQLRVGSVNINDHAYHFVEPAIGWGGVGASGFGRTNGAWGLMEMVNPKFISSDMRVGALEAWWYPYDEKTLHFVRNAARLLYGPATRRSWALLSMLLNPRAWQHLTLGRVLAALRRGW